METLPNYTIKAQDFLQIIKALKGSDQEESIFSIKISNKDFEREVKCNYMDHTKFLYKGETGGESITLVLSDTEEFKEQCFGVSKTEVEYLLFITNTFLSTGEMIKAY